MTSRSLGNENLKYAVLNLPRESDAVEDYGNKLVRSPIGTERGAP
jgi:hypothetical protein